MPLPKSWVSDDEAYATKPYLQSGTDLQLPAPAAPLQASPTARETLSSGVAVTIEPLPTSRLVKNNEEMCIVTQVCLVAIFVVVLRTRVNC